METFQVILMKSPQVFPRKNSEDIIRNPADFEEPSSGVKANYVRPMDRPFESNKSNQRLNDIGFDPIARMVELYDEVSIEILELEWIRDNQAKTKKKYSGVAHSNLLVLKQKLVNDLLRYGYSRVNENTQPVGNTKPGLTINLSSGEKNYKVPVEIEVNGN